MATASIKLQVSHCLHFFFSGVLEKKCIYQFSQSVFFRCVCSYYLVMHTNKQNMHIFFFFFAAFLRLLGEQILLLSPSFSLYPTHLHSLLPSFPLSSNTCMDIPERAQSCLLTAFFLPSSMFCCNRCDEKILFESHAKFGHVDTGKCSQNFFGRKIINISYKDRLC